MVKAMIGPALAAACLIVILVLAGGSAMVAGSTLGSAMTVGPRVAGMVAGPSYRAGYQDCEDSHADR